MLQRSPGSGQSQLAISVLDQAPISQDSSGAEALRNSVDLARLCDRLGFSRYWVAEHHGTPMLACASPEALIGPIAATTARIRVGSGGVMLPHYSPLKVAETFSLLSGLYPGRIDLGLGRASGTDPLTTYRSRAWPGRCPAARRPPSRGCSAPRRRARSGPRSSASRMRSPTSSTATARRSRPTTRAASTPASGWARRARLWRPGRSPPTARRRPGCLPPRAGWRWRCCAAAA